jgi:hypothetical protein
MYRNVKRMPQTCPLSPEPTTRRRVLTIHGIETSGDWQEDVARAFAPHFACKTIKYPHYRWLGPGLLGHNAERKVGIGPWFFNVRSLTTAAAPFNEGNGLFVCRYHRQDRVFGIRIYVRFARPAFTGVKKV